MCHGDRIRHVLLLLVPILLGACERSPPPPVRTRPAIRDREALPPVQREIQSPGGDFALDLCTPDQWNSRKATATLFAIEDGKRRLLWSRPLPHDLGPRFALVGEGGRVLLLDVWINVASRRAVMVLDEGGSVVASHSHEEILALLGLSSTEALGSARHGMWMAGAPALLNSGSLAEVEVAGAMLVVSLADGAMVARPHPTR